MWEPTSACWVRLLRPLGIEHPLGSLDTFLCFDTDISVPRTMISSLIRIIIIHRRINSPPKRIVNHRVQIMALTNVQSVLIITLLLSLYLLLWRRRAASSLPLPPGPSPLPIIGNIHQAPKSFAWHQYHGWSKTYGSIIHLNMAGQSVVVLSTSKVAHDFLSKQGAAFSDRPRFVVG